MGGFERGRESQRQRVRITDHNKAGHFCVASSDILWAFMGERWRDAKGRGGYLGECVCVLGGLRVDRESYAG